LTWLFSVFIQQHNLIQYIIAMSLTAKDSICWQPLVRFKMKTLMLGVNFSYNENMSAIWCCRCAVVFLHKFSVKKLKLQSWKKKLDDSCRYLRTVMIHFQVKNMAKQIAKAPAVEKSTTWWVMNIILCSSHLYQDCQGLTKKKFLQQCLVVNTWRYHTACYCYNLINETKTGAISLHWCILFYTCMLHSYWHRLQTGLVLQSKTSKNEVFLVKKDCLTLWQRSIVNFEIKICSCFY
jgi:hypothetical protein